MTRSRKKSSFEFIANWNTINCEHSVTINLAGNKQESFTVFPILNTPVRYTFHPNFGLVMEKKNGSYSKTENLLVQILNLSSANSPAFYKKFFNKYGFWINTDTPEMFCYKDSQIITFLISSIAKIQNNIYSSNTDYETLLFDFINLLKVSDLSLAPQPQYEEFEEGIFHLANKDLPILIHTPLVSKYLNSKNAYHTLKEWYYEEFIIQDYEKSFPKTVYDTFLSKEIPLDYECLYSLKNIESDDYYEKNLIDILYFSNLLHSETLSKNIIDFLYNLKETNILYYDNGIQLFSHFPLEEKFNDALINISLRICEYYINQGVSRIGLQYSNDSTSSITYRVPDLLSASFLSLYLMNYDHLSIKRCASTNCHCYFLGLKKKLQLYCCQKHNNYAQQIKFQNKKGVKGKE